MSFADNLMALINQRGLTQEEVAKAAGVTPGAVTGWRNGSRPRRGALQNLCKSYKLSEDDLLSETIGLAAKSQPSDIDSTQIPIPLIDGVNPKQEVKNATRFIAVPASALVNRPNAYAITVKDDGISQKIPVGSHAVIDPDEPVPHNGSIVAFKIIDLQSVDVLWTSGDRVLLRKWYVGVSHLMLSPRSYREKLEDIVMRLEDAESTIELLGTVIWYQSSGSPH